VLNFEKNTEGKGDSS